MRRSVGFARVAILALPVWAYSVSFSFAADRIGIVPMHGKGGHPGAGIDTLAAKLKAKSATRIVAAGQSMGDNAAIECRSAA